MVTFTRGQLNPSSLMTMTDGPICDSAPTPVPAPAKKTRSPLYSGTKATLVEVFILKRRLYQPNLLGPVMLVEAFNF